MRKAKRKAFRSHQKGMSWMKEDLSTMSKEYTHKIEGRPFDLFKEINAKGWMKAFQRRRKDGEKGSRSVSINMALRV